MLRAREVESQATGANRIEAFRLTRALIGGARDLGYSAADLATCLGVRVSTLEGRTERAAWINAAAFAELAGIRLDTIGRWRRCRRLPEPRVEDARPFYRASDLLGALIAAGARKHGVLTSAAVEARE